MLKGDLMVELKEGLWWQESWNPWQGCHKVSEGCRECYMYREKGYYGGSDPNVVVRSSKPTFNKPLKLKQPTIIFVCSWSDFFHEDADEWRDEAWEIIRRCPQHIFQIPTKRHERIEECLPEDWGEGYDNVWLGVTVENQNNIERARTLVGIPAKVRWISAEPLIGEVDLTDVVASIGGPRILAFIDWVVAGGESGPKCRPMDMDWARNLRDQCVEYGVAYFLKQLGGHPDKRKGPKALLDGRLWVDMPDAVNREEPASVEDFF
jgi:protein gp37